MPVGHELLIIALNGDSLAAGSTAHYPLTILNHRHKQPESSMWTHMHTHMHSLTCAWENQGRRFLSIPLFIATGFQHAGTISSTSFERRELFWEICFVCETGLCSLSSSFSLLEEYYFCIHFYVRQKKK